MNDYLFHDNLVEKVSNPPSSLHISTTVLRELNPDLAFKTSLLVFVEASEFERIDGILNEITAEYIQNEKLYVYLIDGVKANVLSRNNHPKMQEAVVVSHCVVFQESEPFSKSLRGEAITKERLKTWLDRQLGFLNKMCPNLDEGYGTSIYYKVVTNSKGEFKIWLDSRDIPAGWMDANAGFINEKDEAIVAAERARAEFLENATYEEQSSVENSEEAWRRASQKADEEAKNRLLDL